MTGINLQLIEPIVAFRNSSPLYADWAGLSYLAALSQNERGYFLQFVMYENQNLHYVPTVRVVSFNKEQQKLANDSLVNIAKSLPSKHVDILSFDKKTMDNQTFEATLAEWIKQTTYYL